jgi:hypothetical protein
MAFRLFEKSDGIVKRRSFRDGFGNLGQTDYIRRICKDESHGRYPEVERASVVLAFR